MPWCPISICPATEAYLFLGEAGDGGGYCRLRSHIDQLTSTLPSCVAMSLSSQHSETQLLHILNFNRVVTRI